MKKTLQKKSPLRIVESPASPMLSNKKNLDLYSCTFSGLAINTIRRVK